MPVTQIQVNDPLSAKHGTLVVSKEREPVRNRFELALLFCDRIAAEDGGGYNRDVRSDCWRFR